MKNILQTLLLFTMLFPVITNAYEIDKVSSDCEISNHKNQYESLSEMKICVDEELEKDTKQTELMTRAFTPSDADETTKEIESILDYFRYFIGFFMIISLFKMQTRENLEKQSNGKSDFVFKGAILAVILTTLLSSSAFSYATNAIIKTYFSLPVTFYNTANVVKSQSDTVKKHAGSNSRAEISEKILAIVKNTIQNQTCSLAYQQERISTYSKEDYDIIKSDNEIDCIDKYLEENAGKTLKELGHRLLLSSAVYECSGKFNSSKINCGNIYSRSTIPEVNDAVNKYTNQIAEFTNEYAGYNCNQITDKSDHRTFCTTIKNGVKTTLKTDKTILELESDFFTIVENFSTDFGNALIENMDLPDDFKSETKLLDLYENINSFLSINTYDLLYKQVITNEINSILYTKGVSRNKHDGSILQTHEGVDVVIENAEDFILYVRVKTNSLFHHPTLLKTALLKDFAFITDINLLFGEYANAETKEGFKVNFNFLESVQNHRLKLIAVATTLTILAEYKISKANINDDPTDIWDAINNFAFVIFLIAFSPELLAIFALVLTIGGITMAVIFTACMSAIQLFLILVIRKEPHMLINGITQLYIAFVIKSITVVLALGSTSIVAVIALETLQGIPLINDNYAFAFLVSIVLQCFLFFFVIKKIIWTNSYLQKSLKTNVEGFKGKNLKAKSLKNPMK